MRYRKRYDGSITRTRTMAEDGFDEEAGIPADPGNRDYAEFLEWEAEQPSPLVAEDPPPPDPTVAVRTDIESKLDAALAVNLTYIGIASPTTADIAKQQKALTRQVNALIKLQRFKLSDAEGV